METDTPLVEGRFSLRHSENHKDPALMLGPAKYNTFSGRSGLASCDRHNVNKDG
jgi:hypothetical protein